MTNSEPLFELLSAEEQGKYDAGCFAGFYPFADITDTRHRLYDLRDEDRAAAHRTFLEELGLPELVLPINGQSFDERLITSVTNGRGELIRQVVHQVEGNIGHVVFYSAFIYGNPNIQPIE